MKYVRPGVKVEFKGAGRAEVSYGVQVKQGDKDMNGVYPFSYSAEGGPKLHVETLSRTPKGVASDVTVSSTYGLGIHDAEKFQALGSQKGIKGIVGPVGALGVHFERLDAAGNVTVPLSKYAAWNTQATAQVNNLYKEVNVKTGVQVQASGVQVFTYVGYIQDSKGLMSKTSWSTTKAGLTTESGVKTRGGSTFSVGTQGGFHQGQIKAVIPLFKRH